MENLGKDNGGLKQSNVQEMMEVEWGEGESRGKNPERHSKQGREGGRRNEKEGRHSLISARSTGKMEFSLFFSRRLKRKEGNTTNGAGAMQQKGRRYQMRPGIPWAIHFSSTSTLPSLVQWKSLCAPGFDSLYSRSD